MLIDIRIPCSWSELSQRQLQQTYKTMAAVQLSLSDDGFIDQDQYSAAESTQVKAYCFFLWCGLQVICRYGDDFLVSVGRAEAILRSEDVSAALSNLDWLDQISERPVRLDRIARRRCFFTDDISDMSFETWIALDNLWTGFSQTHSQDIIVQMIGLCYDRPKNIQPFEILSMIYWWAAIKDMMAKRYPDFFSGSPAADPPNYDTIRRNIDTQLRALTKGDPTKEAEILTLRVDRALAELDAQAREAKELERISKQ